MPSENKQFDGEESRRTVVKMLGAAIPGTAAFGLAKQASAGDKPQPGPQINPCGEPTGSCFPSGFALDVENPQYLTLSEACEIAVSGCTFYTALAYADIVPGDEAVLTIGCAGTGFGCALYWAFADTHGVQEVQRVQAAESAGSISYGDYIMVPADWGWEV